MTEYDYSPAAYERYMAQQTRVSNWISDTYKQSRSYSNPFVLSPTLRDRSFYDESDNHTTRPPPPRPNALDQDHRSPEQPSSRPSRSRSKSYTANQPYPDHDRERPSPSRHRSHSQSRSSSTQRSVQVIYQPSPPHQSHAHAHYPQPHVAPRTPATRIHTAPPGHAVYQYPAGYGHRDSATRLPYVTQPAPRQTYQIYRDGPHTTSREQLHRDSSQTRYHSSKPAPQPYLVVQGGGPRAEYKRGVRLDSTDVLVPVLIVLFLLLCISLLYRRLVVDTMNLKRQFVYLASHTRACADEAPLSAALIETSFGFRNHVTCWWQKWERTRDKTDLILSWNGTRPVGKTGRGDDSGRGIELVPRKSLFPTLLSLDAARNLF
ncbi:hypothetical protein BU15DRAFT_73149 [Melanogaster broomeanus]|nr:hypothetical protein BU15DRAFT_73149 [Melanogaster broomeanus]